MLKNLEVMNVPYTIALPDDLVARLVAVRKETGRPISLQVILGTGLWVEEQTRWLEATKRGCPPHEVTLYVLGEKLRVSVCENCGWIELEIQQDGRRKRIRGWPE